MDNNFDESRTDKTDSEQSAPQINGQEIPNVEAAGHTASPINGLEIPNVEAAGHTAPQINGQEIPNGDSMGYTVPQLNGQEIPNTDSAGRFVPQQAMPQYAPQLQAVKKRRFSNLSLVINLVLIGAMLMVVASFATLIAKQDSEPNAADKQEAIFSEVTEDTAAEKVELTTEGRTVVEDEYYEDKETGLLTSVGVAKAILPSQVQIKVFDEVPYLPIATGSGIILTEDGFILTNAHVVDGARRLSVRLYDGSEYEAEVVGIDKKSDLAVISVDAEGLVPARLGTSADLQIGEEVALAGAGGGFENTVTYGHVTGLGREIDTDYMSSSTILCIQSDAALNPGNSGGALVNMYGQVVGVAVALMNHETYENIGFSIAVDDAIPIAEELIAHGYVTSRTRVGITYASLGDAAADVYGVPAGLCVINVDSSSGAADAGLQPYDVITEIDGVRVFGAEEIAEVLAGKVPGDVITVSVFRKEVTGKIDMFDAELELTADTSSLSGYSVGGEENDDFMSRGIID